MDLGETVWLRSFVDGEKFTNWGLLQIYRAFELDKYNSIDITKFELVIFGTRDTVKTFERFRILSFTQFLRGKHVVKWRRYEDPVDVRSILELKRTVFGFTDRAPFDVSTFVIHHGQLYRLKNVRVFITQEKAEVMKDKVRRKIMQDCLDRLVYLHLSTHPNQSIQSCLPEVEKEVLLMLTEMKIDTDDLLLNDTYEDF